MSHERFHEQGEKLFPVSKRTLDAAFPIGTNRDSVDKAIRQEAIDMSENNPHLFNHYNGQRYRDRNFELTPFENGGRFMYRVLRHHAPLPIISPNVLSVYDMEHQRKISQAGGKIKDYFVEKWKTEFENDSENEALAKRIHKVGEMKTERIEEIWAGAYYVAKAFERQINVDEANKAIDPEVAKNMKQIFPDFFTD